MIELANALQPLLLTLKVAFLATVFSCLAGIALAVFMARSRFPGKDWLDAVLTLPLVLPPTVLGYYLIVLLGRKGWLGHFLYETFGISLMFTWQGAVVAAAVVSFPLIFKSARASFESVDHNLWRRPRVPSALPRWPCSCGSLSRWPGGGSSPAPCSRLPAPWGSSARPS